MEENRDIMTTQDRSVTARIIVLGFVGLNAVLLLAAIAIGIGLLSSTLVDEYLFAFSWILTSIVYSGLAVLIIFRQPRHTVGWLFVVIGFLNALTIFGIVLGNYLESSIIDLPLRSEQAQIVFKIIGELTWILALFLPLTLMVQFFPDGRLPSRRWWPITLATVIGILSMAMEFAVEEAGYAGSFAWLAGYSVIFMPIAIFGSLAAVLVRFFRSRDTERLQMKWLVYTAVVGILLMFLFVLILDEDNPILGFYTTFLPSLLATSVGIAILRYHLYDIDIIIRRTLVYSVVTLALIAVYFGSVVLLQRLFAGITEQRSPLAIVISTLLIAALFNPLRRRVQELIDRRFFRRKYDAAQILAQFSQTARDEVDLEKLVQVMQMTVEETLQPETVSIWLSDPEAKRQRNSVS
jgi:hypothetical protein